MKNKNNMILKCEYCGKPYKGVWGRWTNKLNFISYCKKCVWKKRRDILRRYAGLPDEGEVAK